MKKFKGTLTGGNNDTFGVSGQLEPYINANDQDAWRGRVKADDGRFISVGPYTLKIPGEQEIKILISSVPFSSSSANDGVDFW